MTPLPLFAELNEHYRRDKRTLWFYVANAFSILLSSIQPAEAKATKQKF